MPVTEMKDHVYKILELVGSSARVSRMPFKMPSRIKDHPGNEVV